jgi:hypothetical protein
LSERYELEIPGVGVTFVADRLRRERQELIGELAVKCALAGARTVNGFLNTSDFNFSSARAMQDRAKLLKERANTNGNVDWIGLLEDFRQRVFAAEREGDPSVDLRTLERPTADDINVHQLSFPGGILRFCSVMAAAPKATQACGLREHWRSAVYLSVSSIGNCAEKTIETASSVSLAPICR